MLPAASVIVVSHFPEEERGRAMGFYVGIASVFLSLGPFIGGYITQVFSWRWIFLINLPIGMLGAGIAYKVLVHDTTRKHTPITDHFGYTLLIICIGSLVTMLIESNRHAFTSPFLLGLLAVFILTLVLFIRHELRVRNPLIDLSIFKNKTFSTCVMIMLQDQAVVISITFWMLSLQYAMGLSPARSGALLMVCTLPIIFMAPIAGRCRDKFGNQPVIRFGTVLMCASSLWIAGVSALNLSIMWLIPGFFVFGTGAPFVLSTAMAAALSSVDYLNRGTASGVAATGKQLGSSLGLAVWGAIMGNTYFFFLARILQRNISYSGLTSKGLDGLLAGSDSATRAIAHLPVDVQNTLLQQARMASRDSFAICMACVGLVAFVSFLLTWRIPKYLIVKENDV